VAGVDLPLASCRLDAQRLDAQLDRYRTLAADVTETRREPQRLTVAFGPGADVALMREAVAVERECCSFFAIDLDERERTLAIGVADPAMAPSLDAIAYSLGA
jgi:hypothetical protein